MAGAPQGWRYAGPVYCNVGTSQKGGHWQRQELHVPRRNSACRCSKSHPSAWSPVPCLLLSAAQQKLMLLQEQNAARYSLLLKEKSVSPPPPLLHECQHDSPFPPASSHALLCSLKTDQRCCGLSRNPICSPLSLLLPLVCSRTPV